ncbi:tyrosine-type recombinase/integrase [Pontibacter flavimaris]|uniref:Integrase n=1 Tax=Pontibacter flavimaris TaxID=1797110 RepID=A0A1Q5PBD3_9BACT|nr:site-specific integrase [Pontibacter flavimaris]OKL39536.1 integrase [Pontibacter flavimaris]
MSKVKLRSKAISGGRQTLYLDYYPPIPNPETGKLTRREFLGMYTYDKPKTTADKEYNKLTLELAEGIKAKRQVEVNNKRYGFLAKTQLGITLLEYYTEQIERRVGSNNGNWQSSLYYLEKFFDADTKLSELTVNLCNEYKNYLLSAPSQRSPKKKLSQNSAVSYFNKLKATLKQAFKDGILQNDINARIEAIPTGETHTNFLTQEELDSLYDTDCELSDIKQAAIFSALTGLRFSDIEKLLWSEVQYSSKEGYYIQFRQQKTQGVEVLPISDQAAELLGERGEPTAKVFSTLIYSASNNKVLKDWVKAAGITKHITFHCFRHTYATLQLSLGTDIFTVSKLLGHRALKTTMTYAKVIDKTKREAAGRIKLKANKEEGI